MTLELNKIYNEDCLGNKELGTGMWRIPDKSVDMILCDLPYGQTARNKWDAVIPFDKLWEQYERIIKDNGAIVLFANGMFTADLMQSNRKIWKYNLVWNKVLPSGHLNAKKQPMREHEDICLFYKKQPTYNPQMTQGKPTHSRGKAVGINQEEYSRNTNYGEFRTVEAKTDGLKYPKSILTFSKPHPSTSIHPTQKPVELFEYLIKTYSNEGDTVLDNCMGSGTTAVATLNVGGDRKYIGFELENEYCTKANERIEKYIEKLHGN